VSPTVNTPRLDLERGTGGVLRVKMAGDWVSQAGLPPGDVIEKELAGGGITTLAFDTAGLGRWDTGLVSFLFRCQELCERNKIEFKTEGLPEGLVKLLRLAQAVPEKKDAARKVAQVPFLERVGELGMASWNGSAAMVRFLGESVLAFLKMARGQAQFRRSDLWLVIQECGPQALPIVALINFLIGLILAFVGATQLARFGASIYTADLVAVATVREMGCIMTGIILCGRTGAAFAAQLGTMKVNQEIEAFQTFAISPIEFLVLPRLLALILMMPLLCLFADAIAIGGGLLVSTLIQDVSVSVYLRRTVEAITISGFLLGIFKGAFFGVIVALTGCMRGMQCGTNAAAVGEATTSAVVTGITAIIASDGIFAVLTNALRI
jgi:phospholipid/cholesterol/gamma-HCH transport system permease protein